MGGRRPGGEAGNLAPANGRQRPSCPREPEYRHFRGGCSPDRLPQQGGGRRFTETLDLDEWGRRGTARRGPPRVVAGSADLRAARRDLSRLASGYLGAGQREAGGTGHQHADKFSLPGDAGLDEDLLQMLSHGFVGDAE